MRRFGWGVFCILALFLGSACGLLVEEGRDVLARVGGEPIRLNDLLRRIRELPFEERVLTNDADESVRLEARRSVLKALVIEKLLVKEAEARDIKISDEELTAALEREAEPANHSNQLVEGMKGTSGDHEHAHAGEKHSRREITEMREKLMTEKMLKLQFSHEVVRKYYVEHIREFAISPPLVSYELVVVDAEDSSIIDIVHKKATQEQSTLAASLASLENTPPIVFVGTTPPTPLSLVAPTMREKTEKLKVGEISEPFYLRPRGKTQYALARLVGYVDRKPFKEVRGEIYNRLYKDFIDQLQQRYKVVYREERLNYRLGS
ncbi:MAG: SurA N-terminal domain-containing protein [Candidatus Hydrogenedentota bacterium]|nr:MAG: SurA N-terminal domain-containing protein [Candidatus Hydrogenedentota bacterium]